MGATLYELEGLQEWRISTRALPNDDRDGPELLSLCKRFSSKISLLADSILPKGYEVISKNENKVYPLYRQG